MSVTVSIVTPVTHWPPTFLTN